MGVRGGQPRALGRRDHVVGRRDQPGQRLRGGEPLAAERHHQLWMRSRHVSALPPPPPSQLPPSSPAPPPRGPRPDRPPFLKPPRAPPPAPGARPPRPPP